MSEKPGRVTFLCRLVCSAALLAPLLYWWIFAHDGSAYVLLFLVLVALVAGPALFINSVFCLVRYRIRAQRFLSLLFVVVSVVGVIAMPYYLPGFKM